MSVLKSGKKSALERLKDKKNIKKGQFPTSIDECFYLLQGENVELTNEVKSKKRNYKRIREEAGDNIAYLSMICNICEMKDQKK